MFPHISAAVRIFLCTRPTDMRKGSATRNSAGGSPLSSKKARVIIHSLQENHSRLWISSSRGSPPAARELGNFEPRYWLSSGCWR